MSTKRMSLKDRNKAAISLPEADQIATPADDVRGLVEGLEMPTEVPQGQPLEPVAQESVQAAGDAPESRPVSQPAARPPRRPAASRTGARSDATTGGEDGRGRLGVYFRSQPDEFNDARAAYLSDWSRGGNASTFADWVALALDAHAERTPPERARLARELSDGVARGSTRTFVVPDSVSARLRAAIAQDNVVGRWPSVSNWAGDAIAVAVEQARQAAGGHLPTPPVRLPKRLTR